MKKRFRYTNVYVFIMILALIGFICGFIYYKIQPMSIKENISENISYQSNLDKRVNNIGKRTMEYGKKFLFCVFIITSIINVLNIFYEPFLCGFVFSMFSKNIFFGFIYILLYYLIPLIFSLVLTRIGFSISKRIISYFYNKRDHRYKDYLKRMVIKYFIVFGLAIFYESIIFVLSKAINAFLINYLV